MSSDNLWDNVECPNIQIIGVPEEDKKKDHEKILEEIIVEPRSKRLLISWLQSPSAGILVYDIVIQ